LIRLSANRALKNSFFEGLSTTILVAYLPTYLKCFVGLFVVRFFSFCVVGDLVCRVLIDVPS
jgi:hypothetical protein